MYGPDYYYAYQMMQKELETELNKLGRVMKKKTFEDMWGERDSWTYQVFDGSNQIARVSFKMGCSPAVFIDGTLPDRINDYFVKNYKKNYNSHRMTSYIKSKIRKRR